jgi:hypothetical protein
VGPAEALAIFGAGGAAGAVNAVVGSGSLITFPTLLAFGFAPVVANVSNNVGLVSGNVSGAVGYRRELAGQRRRLIRLGVFSMAGSLAGAAALLSLPSSSFQLIVPALILISCALVLAQPWLSARIVARRDRRASAQGAPQAGTAAEGAERTSPALAGGVFGAAVYGGYFGAAQGVILIALLAIFIDDDLQRLNATKNVLALLVNGIAAVLFIAVAHIAWVAAGLLAAGSIIGGQIGATVGRRLPPQILRALIVVVGVAVAINLLR